jgi:hypothetical protein
MIEKANVANNIQSDCMGARLKSREDQKKRSAERIGKKNERNAKETIRP